MKDKPLKICWICAKCTRNAITRQYVYHTDELQVTREELQNIFWATLGTRCLRCKT